MAPSVHVRGTCKSLNELGHKVALIHKSPTGKQFKPDWLNVITDVPWPNIRGGWWLFQSFAAVKLIIQLKKNKPDLIYIRSKIGHIIEIALRFCNVPIVVEINGSGILNDLSANRYFHKCDLILADNNVLATNLSLTFPEHSEKIKTHLTFVTDSEHFKPREQYDASNSAGLEPNVFRLIHVSSFQPWHDFDTMLGAMKILLEKSNRVFELILIGDGLRYSYVVSKIKIEGLEQVVKIKGRINHADLPLYINAAHVGIDVLTNDNLNGGTNLAAYKIYEYMSCARPVITAVSHDYIVPDWANNYLSLIPSENPEYLADAILQIADSYDEWEDKALRSREYVRVHRNWKMATQSTLLHINNILNKNLYYDTL